MPYDEQLAAQVRTALEGRREVSEKKMFGGLAFLLRGHMLCGIVGRDLMVRVGPEAYEEALTRPHAREMDFTGRPMNGMMFVAPEGVRSTEQLRSWIERGLRFVEALPAK